MERPVELPNSPHPEVTPARLITVFNAEGDRDKLPQIDSINNIFQGIKAIQTVAVFYTDNPITSVKIEEAYTELQQINKDHPTQIPLGNPFIDSDRLMTIQTGIRALSTLEESRRPADEEAISQALINIQYILSNSQLDTFQEQEVEVTEGNLKDLLKFLKFMGHEMGHKINDFAYTQLIKRSLSQGKDYTERLQRVQGASRHILTFADNITAIMDPKNAGQLLDVPFAEETIKEKFATLKLNNIDLEVSEIPPDVSQVHYKYSPVLLDLLFDNIIQNTIKAFGNNVAGTGIGMANHSELISLSGGLITAQNIYKEDASLHSGEETPANQIPKLKIRFELSENKETFRIVFEDNGKGFPPEIVNKGFKLGSTNWQDRDPKALGARTIITLPVS